MKKKPVRAVLTIVMTTVLLSCMTLTALAATCWVDGCELTYETSTSASSLVTTGIYDHNSQENYSADATWNSANRQFVLTAGNSTYYQKGGLFSKHNYHAQNYTVTMVLTNGTSEPLKLQYTVSGTVDSHAAGTYTATLLSGESLNFSLSSKETDSRAKNSTTYIGYVKIGSVVTLENVDVSFASSSRGSYTYQVSGGDTVTVSKDEAVSASQSLLWGTKVALNQVTADVGYAFYGWMANGKLLGMTDGAYAVEDDAVIYPVFLPEDELSDEALYKVGSNNYWLWNPAFIDAKSSGNTVIVNRDHPLPTTLEDAGLCAGYTAADYVANVDGTMQYTVPYGYKLLLPYGSGDAGSFSSEPSNYISESDSCDMYDEGGMAARNFAYRTLTVPTGAKIDCSGQINVNGQRQNDGQPYSGVTLGGYGKIALDGAAGEEQLIIKSGATLYCYGYITGAGMVNVQNGGTIHELIQVCDWPGGSNASNWNDAAVANASLFPLSQYYVQNVEADLKLNSGATAAVEAVLTASGSSQTISASYVGTDSGLFQLKNGYVLRCYDESTDRMNYHLHGTVDIGYLEIKKTFLGMEIVNLNSSNYVLPLSNNMTITVESGSVLNMGKQIALMPGSEFTVANGGTVNLSGQIYIVDVKDWSRTYFFNRASMTPPSGDTTATSVTANTSADFAPVPYVATLDDMSPRTTDLVRGSTVSDNGTVAQRYYMKAVNCTASGKLVIDGTMNVSGALCTTSASSSANKVVTGVGTINYNATPNAGKLKGGYSSTIRDMTTTYGLANIVSVGKLQPLTQATYYGGYGPDGSGTGNYWSTGAVQSYGGSAPKKHRNLATALTENTDATYYQMLHNSTEPSISAESKTVCLDLNGKNVTLTKDTTIGTLCGMDSTTDAYTADKAGKITGSGTSNIPLLTKYQPDTSIAPKYYVKVVNDDGYSFHRAGVSVTDIQYTLNTDYAVFQGVFRGTDDVATALKDVGFRFNESTDTWYNLNETDIKSDGIAFSYARKFADVTSVQALLSFDADHTTNNVAVSMLRSGIADLIKGAGK